MRVLVACEFSGVVRDAFLARGHDAVSCDLSPSESPGPHIQGDVLDVLGDGWDLLIAHPPCTYLANSGVRWLYGGRGDVRNLARWLAMEEAAAFFRLILDAPVERIAVENPIMHRYAKEIVGRGPNQTIQPCHYGHNEVKATCLWLKGLPYLRPTKTMHGRTPRVHFMPPSPERSRARSRTLRGVAAAMAAQWGASDYAWTVDTPKAALGSRRGRYG